MDPIVILGSGLAGYTLAREIRQRDATLPIVILTRDEGGFYSKPMLSNALALGKTPESLVNFTADAMAEKYQLEIRPHTHVEEIDAQNRVVRTDKGEQPYTSLILALGASQRRLNTSADVQDKVFSINNLNEYSKFYFRVKTSKHITIIGSGLIGCEFANDLLNLELEIHLVGKQSFPLSGLVPEIVGTQLEKRLKKEGVHWHPETIAENIEISGQGLTVQLSNGESLNTDIVLTAIGLQPEIHLARDAGLKTNKGIIVDRFLRTSADKVYALGDCAEVNGRVMPYVMPIMAGAKALAATLTGNETKVEYPVMPIAVKTRSYPIVVVPSPHNQGEWHHSVDEEGCESLYLSNNNELEGFVLSDKKLSKRNELLKNLHKSI